MAQLAISTRISPQPAATPATSSAAASIHISPTSKPTSSQSALQNSDSVKTATPKGQVPGKDLHFFFLSDNHLRTQLFHKLAWRVANERPDLVIDGGDMTHDGTEPELKRAYALRESMAVPVKIVSGNHDAQLRGPFKDPPPVLPDFQSFDEKGVHFILLDDEDETLSESQFQKLEADLKANQGKTTIVAMHVPPKLSHEPLSVKLGKYLPLNFASPIMHDPKQVERFHQLMTKYHVSTVLAGHTHYPDEVDQDGVHYITAGSSGGLNPKPGIAKEYLDIHVHDGQVQVEHKELEAGKNIFGAAGEAFDFYRDLNNFNHDALGWKGFFPSANVGYQAGFRHVSTDHGDSVAATVGVQAERLTGDKGKGAVFASVGVSAGTGDDWDVGVQSSVGYKHSITGDYNHGVYASVAGTANAGYLHGGATAGVGVKGAVGYQHKNWTVELGQEFATNYQAQTLTAGFRF